MFLTVRHLHPSLIFAGWGWGRFVKKTSRLAPALGVSQFIEIISMNLVTLLCCLSPTYMFNKPISEFYPTSLCDSTLSAEAGLLNKSSHLAAALGVTQFTEIISKNLVTLLCRLSPTYVLNKPISGFYPTSLCDSTLSAEAGLLNKSSHLAPALGVTKFITIIAIYLVTLCCAA